MLGVSTQEFEHRNQSVITKNTMLQKNKHELECGNNVKKTWMRENHHNNTIGRGQKRVQAQEYECHN
jgi:hypothetical protein